MIKHILLSTALLASSVSMWANTPQGTASIIITFKPSEIAHRMGHVTDGFALKAFDEYRLDLGSNEELVFKTYTSGERQTQVTTHRPDRAISVISALSILDRNTLDEVNLGLRELYLAEQSGNQFKLIHIDEVSTIYTDGQILRYKSPTLAFEYDANKVYDIGQDLRINRNLGGICFYIYKNEQAVTFRSYSEDYDSYQDLTFDLNTGLLNIEKEGQTLTLNPAFTVISSPVAMPTPTPPAPERVSAYEMPANVHLNTRSTEKTTPKVVPLRKVHIVKKGDNLYRLAIKYNTTIENLTLINHLPDTHLSIAQVLIVR